MLSFDSKNLIQNASVVAIGNFDGVHLGHQSVLKNALEKAGNDPLVVLTFWPHPMLYFRNDADPFLLGTIAERDALLSKFSAHTVALAFDENLAKTTAEDFIDNFLIQDLKAKAVFVGEDFRFGFKRTGSIETLRERGEGVFETLPISTFCSEDGEVISSSRIRKLLAVGDVEKASELLGRPYQLSGKVIHGEGVGTDFGFPTANLALPKYRLLPDAGIYATRVSVTDENNEITTYEGATYIGTKPTYHESDDVSVETFLCDFSGDLYGNTITLDFISKVRGDKKFESMALLSEQIARDVSDCKNELRKSKT